MRMGTIYVANRLYGRIAYFEPEKVVEPGTPMHLDVDYRFVQSRDCFCFTSAVSPVPAGDKKLFEGLPYILKTKMLTCRFESERATEESTGAAIDINEGIYPCLDSLYLCSYIDHGLLQGPHA